MVDTRVSHYRIVKQLGAGGMGVVYEAVDDHSGRTVVIKAIKEPQPDPDAVRRFEREGRAAAAVKHANVVQIFDAGVAPNGHPFLVFELVPGGSLSDQLRRTGPLPWREAATVGARIARGLGAIHRAGLVHRDMKPANVMLAADGTPKIGDLGLVRADAATGLTKGGLTKSGELLGTLEYIAPEQAEGARGIDARTDLYSFGATLHALIAGRPPFEGAGITLVKKHLLDAPPALGSLVGDVPPALEALVLRLLEKEPDARPSSADEVATALDEIAAGTAAPPRARRGPLVAALAGAIAIATIAAGWVATRGDAPTPATSPPPTATTTATTTTTTTTERSLDPGTGLRVTRAMRDGDAKAHADEVRGLGVTKAGQVISGSRDGTLRVWNPTTGSPVGSPCECVDGEGAPDGVLALALAPDGTAITAHVSGNVARWSLDPARPPVGIAGHASKVASRAAIDIGADGDYAVVGADNQVRRVVSGATSHEPHTMGPAGEVLLGVGLDEPDVVVAASPSMGLLCWKMGDLGIPNVPAAQGSFPMEASALALSPADRSTGYVGDEAGAVRRFQLRYLDDRVAVEVASEEHVRHGGAVRLLALSASGELGASASEGDGVVLAWATSTRGSALRGQLDLGSSDRATALAWHPTERWLAVGTEQGHVLRVDLTR